VHVSVPRGLRRWHSSVETSLVPRHAFVPDLASLASMPRCRLGRPGVARQRSLLGLVVQEQGLDRVQVLAWADLYVAL